MTGTPSLAPRDRVGLAVWYVRDLGGHLRFVREVLPHLRERMGDRLRVFEEGPRLRPFHPFKLPLLSETAGWLWPHLVMGSVPGMRDVRLLHSPCPVIPLRQPGMPIIVTLHDLTPIRMPEVHTVRTTFYFRALLPRLVRDCAAIHVPSESSRRDVVEILRIPEDRVVVVPGGVAPRFFPQPEEVTVPADPPYILSVGVVEPRKNYSMLLRAWERLRERGFPHHLRVVGPRGWKGEAVDRTLDGLRFREDVRFLGGVPESELVCLYRGADLFAYPSLYEGFGLPVLEAMASGTPVVTTRRGSLPEVGGDAVAYCEPDDVDSVADAMEGVLASPDRRADLVRRGRARARTFRWERTADGFVDLYERVLGESRTGCRSGARGDVWAPRRSGTEHRRRRRAVPVDPGPIEPPDGSVGEAPELPDDIRIGLPLLTILPRSGIWRFLDTLLPALRDRLGRRLVVYEKEEPPPRYSLFKLPGIRRLRTTFCMDSLPDRARLDILHCPSRVTPVVNSPRRLIVTLHDLIPLYFPRMHPAWERFIYRGILPRILPRCAAVHVPSEATRRAVLSEYRIGADRVRVVPYAANPMFLADAPPERRADPPFLLYVGTIDDRKNVSNLLRAYQRLRERGLPHRLLLAGQPGWGAEEIWRLADSLPSRDGIRFIGPVTRDVDLLRLYRGASCLLFPSLCEGFGLPVLEAMGVGTPVVTSRRFSLPEVAGDAAEYCDPEDPDSIAETARRILDSPSRSRDLAERGIRRARRFDLDRIADRYVALYRDVLERVGALR